MRELGGVGVALATPLNSDYSIDLKGLERLLNHVVEGGVDYLVVMGTTGESPVFSWKEKLELLEFILDRNNSNLPVAFGLGGNNTFDLVKKSKDLKNYNLSAILSASPYYSRPSQRGIIRHYQLLADAYPSPIILYNVPSRTASNIEPDSTLELSEHENIIGIKEASNDLKQCKIIADNKPDDFLLLAGEDSTTFELVRCGAQGVISVIANLMPEEFNAVVKSTLTGNYVKGKELNDLLIPFYKLASLEGNPVSIKAGLEAKGICSRVVKPPLFDSSSELVEKWRSLLFH